MGLMRARQSRGLGPKAFFLSDPKTTSFSVSALISASQTCFLKNVVFNILPWKNLKLTGLDR